MFAPGTLGASISVCGAKFKEFIWLLLSVRVAVFKTLKGGSPGTLIFFLVKRKENNIIIFIKCQTI
jgi:hypothetical protein